MEQTKEEELANLRILIASLSPTVWQVGGPEVREQHQTARPSATGLETYAGFRLCNIYLGSPPPRSKLRVNSGNFGKHGINLHTLELELRSKRRWRGRDLGVGFQSWEYPKKKKKKNPSVYLEQRFFYVPHLFS